MLLQDYSLMIPDCIRIIGYGRPAYSVVSQESPSKCVWGRKKTDDYVREKPKLYKLKKGEGAKVGVGVRQTRQVFNCVVCEPLSFFFNILTLWDGG
jgi:hypothetical protein